MEGSALAAVPLKLVERAATSAEEGVNQELAAVKEEASATKTALARRQQNKGPSQPDQG